jgi:7,8-dihydroneopterin aldolase/epimerase/oxygenase
MAIETSGFSVAALSDPGMPLMLTCRRLFLRDHVVPVQIGAHAFEKSAPQRVVFNVELFVPYARSTPSADQLAEVVDYDFVRTVIANRIARGHVELQETLCDELVQTLLQHPDVQAVRLSTCKPDVYPDCSGVGVEVFKIKQTSL